MPMDPAKTTTLRCHSAGIAQMARLKEQIDTALPRWEVLSLILDWACTPEGLKTLRDFRADQIRSRQ